MSEPKGYSSAVASVLHHRGGKEQIQTNKSGSYIYDGDASSFHEWEFRTRVRMEGGKEDRYAENMSKVLDGLLGDAFIIAKQCGLDKLVQSGDEFAPAI